MKEKDFIKDIINRSTISDFSIIAGSDVVELFMAEMEINFNRITDKKQKDAIYKKHKGIVAKGIYNISTKTGITKKYETT